MNLREHIYNHEALPHNVDDIEGLADGYIPYTGATTDVDLGANDISTTGQASVGTAVFEEEVENTIVPASGACTIDWTDVTNNPTFTTNVVTWVFGDFKLVSGMTFTASTQAYVFAGRGADQRLNAADKTLAKTVIFDCATGKYTLDSDLIGSTSYGFSVESGTFDANDYNLFARSFNANYTKTRTIYMGNGTWELSSTTPTWAITASTTTLYCEGSTIKHTGEPNANREFRGDGMTYNNVWFAFTGAYYMFVTGSNTFNDFKIEAGRTVNFTATESQKTTVTTFTAIGTSENGITIGSTSAAQHYLEKSGGGQIEVEYCTISYSNASPETTWYAKNSTDGNNNSGWIFGPIPVEDLGNAVFFAVNF